MSIVPGIPLRRGLGCGGACRGGCASGSCGYAGAGMGGIFDSIKDAVGDVLEGTRDLIVNIATLKYFRKGLRWAWANMGEDMRKLVGTIGPIVANMFLPGSGVAAKAAFTLLEGDRVDRETRKKARADLEAIIRDAVADGALAPGLVDLDNPMHLEAIWLAGNMPDEVRAKWFKDRGLAPAGKAGASPALAPPLVAAGLLAAAVML